MNDMNADFVLSMGYNKAWRSKEKDLNIVRGDPNDAYQKLPIYLYILQKSNSRTITINNRQ